jgi:hypothetical protein
MTNEVIDQGNGSQGQVQAGNEGQAQGSSSQSEGMVSASRMNEIVHERTRAAADKGYQRGLDEANKAQASQAASSMGGMTQMSEAQYKAMAREEMSKLLEEKSSEFARQREQQKINDIAYSYLGKLDAATAEYPDLASRREELSEFAELIPFINELDNAAGITDHLLNNGQNIASLLILAEKSPSYARRELKKLSDSIQKNSSARNWPHVNEPLSQINSSTNTMDSGSNTIESRKNDPFLRG